MDAIYVVKSRSSPYIFLIKKVFWCAGTWHDGTGIDLVTTLSSLLSVAQKSLLTSKENKVTTSRKQKQVAIGGFV